MRQGRTWAAGENCGIRKGKIYVCRQQQQRKKGEENTFPGLLAEARTVHGTKGGGWGKQRSGRGELGAGWTTCRKRAPAQKERRRTSRREGRTSDTTHRRRAAGSIDVHRYVVGVEHRPSRRCFVNAFDRRARLSSSRFNEERSTPVAAFTNGVRHLHAFLLLLLLLFVGVILVWCVVGRACASLVLLDR